MANLRTRKDLDRFYQKQSLLNNVKTPLGIAVALRTKGGGASKGYLNRLNRQQKKIKGQLRGLPGCGENVRDWMRGY